MEYPKKEIIKEITDLFEDYEETYVPGEWEAFSARKKKRYPFYMQWISAAAAVLLISSVVFFNVKKDVVKKKDAVQLSTVKPAAPRKTVPETVVSDKPERAVSDMPADTRKYASRSAVKDTKADRSTGGNMPEAVIEHDASGAFKDESPVQLTIARTDTVAEGKWIAKADVRPAVTGTAVPQIEVKAKKEKLSMTDFLAMESKAADKAAKKKDTRSKWNFGLQVMPAVTGSNVDFGGGVTTAYRISEKFSLSSGVSLLQMQAGKDVPPAPVQASYALSSISASPEKKLTAVGTDIRALDIPVAVIYKVNKHFYTSAGVSLFNVLSEKRSNTYFQTSQVDNMAVNPATGFVSTYKSLQTTEIMESVVPGTSSTGDDPVKQNNSIGFFNFSIGRQQNIFNKYSIQIEPFIKVPLGKFSSENLNLLNSGIKFQFSF